MIDPPPLESLAEQVIKIDHIAHLVRDVDKSSVFYTQSLGFSSIYTGASVDDGVRVNFLRLAEKEDLPLFELISPLEKESVLSKRLEKTGEGFHHICFEVKNICVSLEILKTQKVSLIDEAPRNGISPYPEFEKRIAFLHPRSCQGLLVELSEKIVKAKKEI